jgi:hypothetical protein
MQADFDIALQEHVTCLTEDRTPFNAAWRRMIVLTLIATTQ